MTSRRVTVSEVAERARVSRQTVSNALNRPHVVQSATLARVRQAVAELGYRPMPAARHLRSGRSRTIAFALPVTPTSISGISDRFLHALTAAAQHRDHRVLLFAAGSDREDIRQYEALLDGRVVDAFVLADTHHNDTRTAWLADHGATFATFGRPWGTSGGAMRHDWVDVDGAAGTRAAVDHLATLGHTRIGFVGWPVGSGVGDDRRGGWATALRDRRITPDGLTREALNNPTDGAAAARSLLAEGATALVCASDSLALGAWSVARAGDAGVVGFDDTPVAEAVGLSSVSQPLREAAERIVGILLDDGEAASPRRILLAPTLVERSSSRPPPRTEP